MPRKRFRKLCDATCRETSRIRSEYYKVFEQHGDAVRDRNALAWENYELRRRLRKEGAICPEFPLP